MTAEILAVGTELLLGDIVNTNAPYLARELANLGIGVLHQEVVGDNPGRLRDAIREALSRSDILITSGGLGPTGDDITRETVAEVLGLDLLPDEESMRRIEQYFASTGRKMTDNNRKQALLPRGAVVFQNDWGTAPGCAVEQGGKIVIMLPGPPRELHPLFDHRARPYLARFADGVIRSASVRVFGIPESTLQAMLDDMMQGENPTLSPYAKDGEVLLRTTARAQDTATADAMLRPVLEELQRRLGDTLYGENVDSLEQVVVSLLQKTGKHVATAESCTGGLLSQRLTGIPGCSEVFECGVVSYANRIKHRLLGVQEETLAAYGAVSPQTAAEMAEGVRTLAGADYGAGITGIAGPGGGTVEKPVGLVYVGVSDGATTWVRRLLVGHGSGDGERAYIRYLSASHALDMLRRAIAGLPQTEPTEVFRRACSC